MKVSKVRVEPKTIGIAVVTRVTVVVTRVTTAMPMVLGSTLTLLTFVFFLYFFAGSGVRVGAMVKVRFRVYLLHLLRFYQAYCTLVVCYCYITSVGRARTGVSIATA